MASVDYFEQWGRAPLERILSEFDGACLHIHGNGRHLLKAVAGVKGVKSIWLGDDKGYPLAFDVLHEIKEVVGDVPLAVALPYQRFHESLRRNFLPGGVF